MALALLIGTGIGTAVRAGTAGAAPTEPVSEAFVAPAFDSVRRAWRSSEAQLLDRHGELLHVLRVDETVRRFDWVALDAVSPALVDAVVRAEDKRFWDHGGVDWRALGDAAVDTMLRNQPRGASTVTMQVAGMLDPRLVARGARRSVAQKLDQIGAARALERAWGKREILEAYLNLSTFRGEVVGIGAAAELLFGRRPDALDARASALLAALLRGPNAPASTVARRACPLVGAGDCVAVTALAQSQLMPRARAAIGRDRPEWAPHVARALLSTQSPSVRTTLDARLQRQAVQILGEQLRTLARRNVRDAAALVLDNASGEVLVYVGNTGPGASAVFVDGVRAPRQAGSTLKPFVYAQAIESRLLTAAALLDDSPARIPTPGGLYVPENYDHEFRGPVSVRFALAGSLNVPAVRTLLLVGPDAFTERLRAFGFEDVRADGDWYGSALALGSAEVTLWQLVNAYRALAEGGRWSKPRWLPAPRGREVRVLSEDAAFIVADILADRAARSATFGLDSALGLRVRTAVKTGTSKDMRDNWCIGFSTRYTVGVWVGNFDGSPMQDVSGTTGAAPAWAALMQSLHAAGEPAGTGTSTSAAAAAGRPPANVLQQRVRFADGLEPDREEWFIRGTEVDEVLLAGRATPSPVIAWPADGTLFALDPDIPPRAQRMRFDSSVQRAGLAWRLDGSLWPVPGSEQDTWSPTPGRHRLELLDADGTPLDVVQFEVRGAHDRRAPSPRGAGPRGTDPGASRRAERRATVRVRPRRPPAAAPVPRARASRRAAPISAGPDRGHSVRHGSQCAERPFPRAAMPRPRRRTPRHRGAGS